VNLVNSAFVSSSGIPIIETSMDLGIGAARPMFVEDVALSVRDVHQSTPFPCADNTITVTLNSQVTLLAGCDPVVTISGLQGTVTESGPLEIMQDGDVFASTGAWTQGDGQIVVAVEEDLEAGSTYSFSFEVENPTTAVNASTPFLSIVLDGDTVADMQRMLVPQQRENRPITVFHAMFETTNIVQNTPYPSNPNVLTVKWTTNVPLPAACDVVVTISGLDGACVVGDEVMLQGDTADVFSASPDGETSMAAWDDQTSSITLYITDGMPSQVSFRFDVKNPNSPQTSPDITIEASSIPISPVLMGRNVDDEIPPTVFDGTVEDGLPLSIRGLSAQSTFTTRNIGQMTADAGAQNTIMVTLVSSVPLTAADPQSRITLSGLTGEFELLGMQPSEHFSMAMHDEFLGLVLAVEQTTQAGVEYMLSFHLRNPVKPQRSPTVSIQSSGIVIQPVAMLPDLDAMLMTRGPMGEEVPAPRGFGAPLTVLPARLTHAYVEQRSHLLGAHNTLTFSFRPSIRLYADEEDEGIAFVFSGLRGASMPMSPMVSVMGAIAGHAAWDPVDMTLVVPVSGFEADMPISVMVDITNPRRSQSAPEILVEMTSNLGVSVPPVPMHAEDRAMGTNRVALMVFGTASFGVKRIYQSTPAAGATNTITVMMAPERFHLHGSNHSRVTISGLKGAATHDGMLTLLESSGNSQGVFNSEGAWTQSTGTLVLTVRPDQMLFADVPVMVMFDLMNPRFEQPGPVMVELSASGTIPFPPAKMDTMDDDSYPLRVRPSSFVTSSITTSSIAPMDDNQIDIVFRPSALLSRNRGSVITVDGLLGSDTPDTALLPIEDSSAVFAADLPQLGFSFSEHCRLRDHRIMLRGIPEGDSPEGTMLHFTEGRCEGRSTRIEAWDAEEHCAHLMVEDGSWTDGHSPCDELGLVDEIEVVESHGVFESGDFMVMDGVGEGLEGHCVVNRDGEVVDIVVEEHGRGYSEEVRIMCPSACDDDVCSAGPRLDMSVMTRVKLEEQDAIVEAARWCRASGTLSLAVFDMVGTGDDSFVTVHLRNQVAPKEGETVHIMASGMIPIGATPMHNAGMVPVMKVAELRTTVTTLCTCDAMDMYGGCHCSAEFTELPPSEVYALTAAVQCNSAAEIEFIVVGGEPKAEDVMLPETCMDTCSDYFRLLNSASVRPEGGSLAVEIQARGVKADHCGAGHYLKVVLSLQIGEGDMAPPMDRDDRPPPM